MTVVVPFKLDDSIAPGEPAGEADGAHGRFGTRAGHAYLIHRRYQSADRLRHRDFQLSRAAEGQAQQTGITNSGDHFRVGMSRHHRAPGADVVHVALSIGIKEVGTFGTLHEYGSAAYALESPYG